MNPSPPESRNGRIVVWLAPVSASQASLSSLNSYLDARDLERAARFRFDEDRARFILGRALARECLGRWLNRVPASLDFIYTRRGRPVLAGHDAVHFSLSHTRDLVAVAVTHGAQVGIDLEYLRQDVAIEDLAPSVFSEDDRRRYDALPADERRAAFFRAWTRKEAYLKARGEGITEGLEQVSVSFSPAQAASIRDARDIAAASAWQLVDLPVPPDYAGSLACDDRARPLELGRVRFNPGEVIVQTSPG